MWKGDALCGKSLGLVSICERPIFGKRRRGRPKVNLENKIQRILSDRGLTITEAAEIAEDRGARRKNF